MFVFHSVSIRLWVPLENQGWCNINRFLCEFRQRVISCYLEDWYSALASKDSLAFDSSFTKMKPFSCRLFVSHKKSSFKKKDF